MPCPAFEERLLDYADLSSADRAAVDSHVALCQGCREYLGTLEHVDQSLTSLLGPADVSPDFAARVRTRVGRSPAGPGMLPELLDFMGWSAIVTILSLIAAYLATPSIPVFAAAATAYLAAAAAISLRSHADLKE